ncbi:MAG: hypothetical protein ACYCXW_22300 [Solirubrobacteraceae bacterium]
MSDQPVNRSSIRVRRAQLMSEAVVSAYIHELAPPRHIPSGPRLRTRNECPKAALGRSRSALITGHRMALAPRRPAPTPAV